MDNVKNNHLFHKACYRGQLKVAKWLLSLNPNKYQVNIKNNCIVRI